VRRAGGGSTVTSARPDRVPAAALSVLADANGRPVCFLLVGDDLPPDGEFAALGPELLERTLNHALLADGSAYLTLYDSLAPRLRRALRAGRRDGPRGGTRRLGPRPHGRVRADGSGVHRPGGRAHPAQAVPARHGLPRDARAPRDAAQLAAHHGGRDAPEDDRVLVGRIETRLSELVEQRNRTIAFSADPLDLVFIEK
jgi:hypothetical protein